MKRTFEEMSYPAPNTQQTPPQTTEHGQVALGHNQDQTPPHGGNLVIGNNPHTPEHAHANGDNQFHTPINGTPTAVASLVLTPVFQYHTPVGTPNQHLGQHAGMAAFYAQNGIIPMGHQHQGGAVVINSPHNDDLNIVRVMRGDMTPVSTPGSVVNDEVIIQAMQGDQGIQLFPNTPDNSDNESATDGSNTEENNTARNLFGNDSDNEEETQHIHNPLHFPDLPGLNQGNEQVADIGNDGNIINPFTGQAFGSVLGPDSDTDEDLVQRVAELTTNDHGDTTSESGDSNKDNQEMLGQTSPQSSYESDDYDF